MSGPSPVSGAPLTSDDLPERVVIGIVVAIIVVVAVLGAVVFVLFVHSNECDCPSDFTFYSVAQSMPGSPGCASPAQEICYSGMLLSSVSGLHVSDLSFKVLTNPASGSVTNGTPVPLGPGAEVTLFVNPTTTIGIWNWTAETWISGGENLVPGNLTVVLDTGLVGTPLSSDWWFIFTSGPEQGGGGDWV
ncbi:MAG: hypothetical protein ACLPZM_04190 [Thermoplasmata archaeon]